jgi:hypothetical protein
VNDGNPLPRGFMKSGFFAWPERKYTCIDCGAAIVSTSGNKQRCSACRKLHLREYHRRYKKLR